MASTKLLKQFHIIACAICIHIYLYINVYSNSKDGQININVLQVAVFMLTSVSYQLDVTSWLRCSVVGLVKEASRVVA